MRFTQSHWRRYSLDKQKSFSIQPGQEALKKGGLEEIYEREGEGSLQSDIERIIATHTNCL